MAKAAGLQTITEVIQVVQTLTTDNAEVVTLENNIRKLHRTMLSMHYHIIFFVLCIDFTFRLYNFLLLFVETLITDWIHIYSYKCCSN